MPKAYVARTERYLDTGNILQTRRLVRAINTFLALKLQGLDPATAEDAQRAISPLSAYRDSLIISATGKATALAAWKRTGGDPTKTEIPTERQAIEEISPWMDTMSAEPQVSGQR
ncbi:hypothetical protein GCM10009087_03040 [Sphingomonas oligophenolica]